MEFPLQILMQGIADFLLPLTRIAAMFGLMAGIGAKTVPIRIKMGLAVALPCPPANWPKAARRG